MESIRRELFRSFTIIKVIGNVLPKVYIVKIISHNLSYENLLIDLVSNANFLFSSNLPNF